MSDAEMTELLIAAAGLADSTFEYWVSATFALVIAAHYVGTSLPRHMKGFLALMYVLVTALLIYRYTLSSDIALGLGNKLNENGMLLVSQEIRDFTPIFYFVRYAIFVIGSLGALYFLMTRRKGA
ncbi:MAG: hypothetical protein ACE363_10030 [Alphaproteobacteria bacterium]